MDLSFPHRDRKRLVRRQGQPIDYAALVASLAAAQAVSTTARAEEVAGRPRHDDRTHAALLRVFAPRRSERRSGIAALAGSFHLATARALASTTEQPE